MYHALFAQMSKELRQVEKWFDLAVAHAEAKKFDPDLFLGFRLAPDQFALVRQVQTTCDTAKLAASRLTGKEAPKHEDKETTIAELRARIHAVLEFVEGCTAKDFEGAAARVVSQPRWEGKTMTGANYFLEHALPNFFFHLTNVYAILRHNGVPIGKRDYLGALTFTAPA
ncbi:MAG: DUF1993 domain-containing protein [Myxococcales bacterium]|nr:DUF1993 domain-containing protein [Myxococcales bacterium]